MAAGRDNLTETRLLSLSEVATVCGVSVRTVRRWIAADGLSVHLLPGRGGRPIIVVSHDDLANWLAQFRADRHGRDDDSGRTIRLEGRRFFKQVEGDGQHRGRSRRRA